MSRTTKQVRKHRNTARYKRARQHFLEENPLCMMCQREGFVRAATELDHIIPAWKHPERFWDESNWQGLCHGHHERKSMSERRGRTRVTIEGNIEVLTHAGWQPWPAGQRRTPQPRI